MPSGETAAGWEFLGKRLIGLNQKSKRLPPRKDPLGLFRVIPEPEFA
jgi:hypothetical protein